MTPQEGAMDVEALRERALDRMVAVVRGVGADQWHDATPCEEWDVADLVSHVARENLWSVDLAAGRTLDEVGDRYDGDVLGGEPVAAFERAAGASVAALRDPGSRPARVHTSMGLLPVERYLSQMFTDALVHGWDLAVATGQDATMDPALARACLDLVTVDAEDVEQGRHAGIFGTRVEVDRDAPAQDRLLGLLGRDPRTGRNSS